MFEVNEIREGEFFKVCNPTFGTGIAMGIQTGFSDTANVLFLMRNGSPRKKVVPLYLRLINTAAGASTTSAHLGIVIDNANRYNTGGTDLLAQTSGVNSDASAPNASGLGAVDLLRYNCTALAAVSKRQVARVGLKIQAAPCWVVGDEVLIVFGDEFSQPGTFAGSTPQRFVHSVGPTVLSGLGHCLLVHMWNVANATTPPSWEFEFAWRDIA